MDISSMERKGRLKGMPLRPYSFFSAPLMRLKSSASTQSIRASIRASACCKVMPQYRKTRRKVSLSSRLSSTLGLISPSSPVICTAYSSSSDKRRRSSGSSGFTSGFMAMARADSANMRARKIWRFEAAASRSCVSSSEAPATSPMSSATIQRTASKAAPERCRRCVRGWLERIILESAPGSVFQALG